MKRFLLITALLTAHCTLLSLSAQDDMYFMPSKAEIKKQKEAKQLEKKTQIVGYYSGISKSDDEYNRHITKDSLGDDIIEFHVGNAQTDTSTVKYYNLGDTTVLASDVDYRLSKLLSRFDDYYYGWYDPWFCSRYYWGRPWYYGPYWYDPWFDPWFYGYYSPYWFRYWAFWGWPYDPWYDPWFYRPWYRPWYGPGFIVIHEKYRPGYGPRDAGQRGDSHFYANHTRQGQYNGGGNFSSHRGSYAAASRNGDATTRMTGRSSFFADHGRGWNNNADPFNRNFSRSDYSSQSRSFGGGGSGFSGGGISGGGGGGFSGGGGHGGAGFGGHGR